MPARQSPLRHKTRRGCKRFSTMQLCSWLLFFRPDAARSGRFAVQKFYGKGNQPRLGMQEATGGLRKQKIRARSAETLTARKSTILLAASSTQPCRKLTDESAGFLNPTTPNQFKLTSNALSVPMPRPIASDTVGGLAHFGITGTRRAAYLSRVALRDQKFLAS